MLNKIFRRILSFLVICYFSVFSPFFIFAQTTEEITITTYYPSPYGVYNTLRIYPTPQPATCQEGELSYSDGTGGITRGLYVCDNTGNWNSAGGGFWAQSGTDISNTNSGNVGIGTAAPSKKLEVTGGIKGTEICLGNNCITSWGLKQIKETRVRGGTWPGYNCATASGDNCQGTGGVGSWTCGQPYHCTQADATSGRVCTDVWGYNGWDALDTVTCSIATIEWAGSDPGTGYTCTDGGPGYDGCTGY